MRRFVPIFASVTSAAAILAICGLTGSAQAQAAAPPCPQISSPDFHVLLLPPPCDSCAITKAELAELQTLQSLRTPATTKHASDDYIRTPERFLAGMGIEVAPHSLGIAASVLKCAAEAAEKAVDDSKMKFNRTRPYKLPDNGLEPLKKIGADDAPSYPSGHSAFGSVTGLVLTAMDPDLAARFTARIEDFGYSRLVSGVHFRTDVYAGEIVGATIAAILLEDDAFRRRVVASSSDLRKALAAAK